MRVVKEKAVIMNQTSHGYTGIPNMVACVCVCGWVCMCEGVVHDQLIN